MPDSIKYADSPLTPSSLQSTNTVQPTPTTTILSTENKNDSVTRQQDQSTTSNPVSTTNSTAVAAAAKSGTQLVFIHKLYGMLEDESLNHLIWWSENSNGSDSFLLIPNTDFSKLLSIYFKHSNIASFVRQLNMYGFHKVNDSNDTSVPIQSKEECISVWEFKHNSGFFKKDDMENLKNIKRRSSKNMAREINIKQIDRIQNYIPKNYEDDEFNNYEFNNSNNEIMLKLNELNYNYNLIKNDHFNLKQKYDMAIEDLKKTNFDLITVLDLIKDVSNNNNKDLENLVNKLKSNIQNRNSSRDLEFANLSTMWQQNNSNLNPTSVPSMLNHYSRINSFDSTSRDSIFMNKDIRYSSVSSSSKRHQSILYDPLTTDPFQSQQRQNSTPEIIRQPQPGSNYASPISPSQLPQIGSSHYFQDHHFGPQLDQHHHLQQQQQPHMSLRDQPQNMSSSSIATYNSVSSTSIPIANTAVNKNTSYTSAPQRLPLPLPTAPPLPHQPLSTTSITSATSANSIEHHMRENSPDSPNFTNNNLYNQSSSTLNLNKLQPPFESNENLMRRGRSDSVSDRLLFKRSKS